MFRDREDAGVQLAQALKGRKLENPLVVAIPRGGVVTGAALARELSADLDVVLSRKLRAPGAPELAIGAVAEGGYTYLAKETIAALEISHEDLALERDAQVAQIEKRSRLIRSVLPRSSAAKRTVIVTDDGIATGATMIAALRTIRLERPAELLVAVPVAPAERFAEVARLADEVVCLCCPDDFVAVSQFYRHFSTVSDEEMLAILREFSPQPLATPRATEKESPHVAAQTKSHRS